MNDRVNILFVTFVLLMTGCFSPSKTYDSIQPGKEYKGKYITTSKGLFFVIENNGSFKKNIALRLPDHFPSSRDPYKNLRKFYIDQGIALTQKAIFIVNKDSGTYNRNVSIFNAKASFNNIDATFADSLFKNKRYDIHKIKILDGQYAINAYWVDEFRPLKKLIVYSKWNSDSVVINF